MSILVEGSGRLPHYLRGLLTRTTGPLKEGEETCVYLHIQEIEGKLKGTEAALIFRVSKDISLNALLAKPGDTVTVEWIPDSGIEQVGKETTAKATRFHLSRKVHEAFGDGFDQPDWYQLPKKTGVMLGLRKRSSDKKRPRRQ